MQKTKIVYFFALKQKQKTKQDACFALARKAKNKRVHFFALKQTKCIPALAPKAKKANMFALDDLRPADSRPEADWQSAAARPPAGRRPRHKAKKRGTIFTSTHSSWVTMIIIKSN